MFLNVIKERDVRLPMLGVDQRFSVILFAKIITILI